jgi:transcription initiation factor TFIIIB Brf1 subunit/transcription initiation factor TFIIB
LEIINCLKCGEEIEEKEFNIDPEWGTAACIHCESVFNIRGYSGLCQDIQELDPEMPRPKRISGEINEDVFYLKYKWFNINWYGTLFFCFIFDVISIDFYRDYFSKPYSTSSTFAMLIFTIVILFSHYSLIICYFNSTNIKVTNGFLSIKIKPFPDKKDLCIPLSDIIQVFCKVTSLTSDDLTAKNFGVFCITKENEKKALIDDFIGAEEALYLEQELKKRLNIK